MADNFTWEESASGIEFASDDVSGVHYQKVKVDVGADGSSSPWTGAVTIAQPSTIWRTIDEYSSAQTNDAVKAAPGEGLSLYVTDVIFNTAVAGTLKLLDGSGGTVLVSLPGMAANGGAALHFRTPLKLTANTALCATTTGTGNMGLTVCGYTAA